MDGLGSAQDAYDVAVIGAGTAGMVAARLTAQAGHKVALIEEGRFGGECLNTGCVPSKAMIASAKVFSQMRHAADYGLHAEGIAVDFPQILGRKDAIIAEIAKGENAAVFRKIGIDVIEAHAAFLGTHVLKVGDREVAADHIVIATGSQENLPPIEGIRDIGVMTNIEVLQTAYDLPRSVVVLGGGPVGCEFAQLFARLDVPVTIVGRNKRLLPKEDPEMSAAIEEILLDEGITIYTGIEAKRASVQGDEKIIVGVREDKEITVRGAMVIAAAGRKARIAHLDLAKAGIEYSPRGVKVRESLQTNVPHIWAAGDCTGLYQFTHVADYQGRLVAENIGKPGKRSRAKKADYRVVPWVTFTDPEVARVGMTEEEARAEYGDKIEVLRWPFDRVDRAVTMGETQGFIKVILAPKGITKMLGGGQIAGAHIIGPRAGDILHELVVTMQANAFAGRVAQAIHAYPTLALGIRQAVGQRWDAGIEPPD